MFLFVYSFIYLISYIFSKAGGIEIRQTESWLLCSKGEFMHSFIFLIRNPENSRKSSVILAPCNLTCSVVLSSPNLGLNGFLFVQKVRL